MQDNDMNVLEQWDNNEIPELWDFADYGTILEPGQEGNHVSDLISQMARDCDKYDRPIEFTINDAEKGEQKFVLLPNSMCSDKDNVVRDGITGANCYKDGIKINMESIKKAALAALRSAPHTIDKVGKGLIKAARPAARGAQKLARAYTRSIKEASRETGEFR